MEGKAIPCGFLYASDNSIVLTNQTGDMKIRIKFPRFSYTCKVFVEVNGRGVYLESGDVTEALKQLLSNNERFKAVFFLASLLSEKSGMKFMAKMINGKLQNPEEEVLRRIWISVTRWGGRINYESLLHIISRYERILDSKAIQKYKDKLENASIYVMVSRFKRR